MSSGSASNSYLYGGADGNPASVTAGGNLGAQLNYTNIVNIGRLVLRTGRVTRLQDIPAALVMVFNAAGNGNVWYAGFDTNVPAVGVGMPIPANTSVNLACTNANQISFTPEVDGNQIYVIAFATGTVVPVTPSNPPVFTLVKPTLTPFNPAVNPATNVAVFKPIVVQSSAALDSTTVNNTTVTASPTMTATISIDTANAQNIVVTPTANLSLSTSYAITYGTGIADLNGNTLASPYVFNITTASSFGTPDTTPPTVAFSSPAPFSSSNNPSVAPTITFSEAITFSSINSSNVTAFITDNTQQINGLAFSLSADLKTLTVNNMNLVSATNYQINIIGGASGLMDLSGNHFATTFVIPFATSAISANIIYSVTGNSYDTMGNSGWFESSIFVKSSRSLLVGTVPIGYTLFLRRVGSPSGNITIVWERLGGGFGGGNYSDFRTLATIAASSISTTIDQTITISDSANSHSLQQNDLISIRYQNGDSSNYILAKISNYDAFDGSNTCSQKTDTNFDDTVFSSSDLAGSITIR